MCILVIILVVVLIGIIIINKSDESYRKDPSIANYYDEGSWIGAVPPYLHDYMKYKHVSRGLDEGGSFSNLHRECVGLCKIKSWGDNSKYDQCVQKCKSDPLIG